MMFSLFLVAILSPHCVQSSDDAMLVQTTPTRANRSNGTAVPSNASKAPIKPMSAAQGQVHENATDKEEEVQLSTLMSKPESVFKAMTEQVGSLSGELDQVRSAGQQTLANQQVLFEKKLKEQREANAELETSNSGLSEEISKLTTTNRQLWQRGKELQKENEQQRSDLRDMRARVGDAMEYADNQLKQLEDADAKEEAVISELDQLDTERQATSAHKESLSKIAKAGKIGEKVAMLQGEIDPAAILKTMQENIAALNAEQKASETKLKDIFKAKFEAEATKRASLLEQQTKLTDKKTSLSAMLARLTDAVKHLEAIRDKLKQAIVSLSSFAEKIGKEHADKQTTGEKKVSLSEEGPAIQHHEEGDKKGLLSKVFR